MLVQNKATQAISTLPQQKQPKQPYFVFFIFHYRKLTQNQILLRIATVCLYKIWLLWLFQLWQGINSQSSYIWYKHIIENLLRIKFYLGLPQCVCTKYGQFGCCYGCCYEKKHRKKIKKLKFYKMSKYHVFRKKNFSYFLVPLNVKSDFFREVLK